MPTVPRVTGQAVDVNVLPSPRLPATATPNQFGAQLGRTIAESGQDIFTYYKRRADDTALMEADRRLLEFETEFMYGDNGATRRTGKNAATLPNEFNQQWVKVSGDIRQGLTEDQRLAFDKRASTRRSELQMNVQRHVATQLDKYEDEETKAYVDSLVDHAGKNFHDPNVIAQSGLLIETTLANYAKLRGLGPAWTEGMVESTLSKMHAGVLDQMLAGDQTKAAREYFKQNRSELEPETAARIEKAVNTSTVRGESQQKSDEILAQAKNMTEALAMARKIEDPEVRDWTEQRVKADWAARDAIDKEQKDDRFLEATNIVEKGGVNAIPTPVWEKLTLSERSALRAYQKQRIEGIEPKNKDEVYVDFLALTVQDVAKLTKADMMTKYRPHLDDAHFNSVLSRWDTFRTALEKKDMKDPQMTSVLSDDERMRNALRSAGVIKSAVPTEMSKKEKEAVAEIQPAYERELNAMEVNILKRKATPDEKDKLLSDMFGRKVFVERSWTPRYFENEKPVRLLSEEEISQAYVPLGKIPASAKDQLRLRARMIGAVPITTQLVDIDGRITERMERAYGAALTGATDDEIDAILKGMR